MPSLEERINAEYENIDDTLAALPRSRELFAATRLELAGTAALLHNFYNGVENVLKQIITDKDGTFSFAGEFWHRELLRASVEKNIVSEATGSELRSYLAFRHFFVHSYALTVDPERLLPLVESIQDVYERFQADVVGALGQSCI